MSNGHKTNVQDIMYLKEKERKKKDTKILTTSRYKNTPPKKISYTNPPPISMTTHISKLLPIFVTSDKRVSTSSRHLIITGRASTIILITIIIRVTIVVLVLRNL